MTPRYSRIAVILHWCIASGIIAMLISGLVLHKKWLSEASLFQLFQWHKSLGVTLLLLIFIRIVWRLFNRPPKQPAQLSDKEHRASNVGHFILYLFLMCLPLSGWLIVSSSELQVPTLVFNLFKWPHLPLPESLLEASRFIGGNFHYYGAIIFTLLLAGHVAMVLLHARQGLNLFERMPFNRSSMVAMTLTIGTVALLSINSLISAPQALTKSTSSAQTGEIQFSGVHADKQFNGSFKEWSLSTQFNSANNTISAFELNIDASSFSTGKAFYDETLKEEDWFNPDSYPSITFIASDFKPQTEKEFQISGMLTLKGKQTPLTFTAIITDGERLDTSFTLSRLQLGLGVDADPGAEWVDDEIKLTAWSKLN